MSDSIPPIEPLAYLDGELSSAHRNGFRAARAADGLNDFRGKAEADIFRHHFNFFDAREAVLTQIIDDVFDQDLQGPKRRP